MKKLFIPILLAVFILLIIQVYFYIKNTNINKNITYEIIEEDSYCDIVNKSFKYNKNTNIVEIYLGEKNTGGYEIKIDNIKYRYNIMTITISEVSPPSGSMVTDAFTQPCIKIKPSLKANKVEEETGNFTDRERRNHIPNMNKIHT